MTAPRPWPPTNPAGHYWRPNLNLWRWSFVPPATRAAFLYSAAWTATSVLAGVKVWRAITEQHNHKIGDR